MEVREEAINSTVADFSRELAKLQALWEEIGIPEEERLQKICHLNKQIKDFADRMIDAGKEELKRKKKSIQSCDKELDPERPVTHQ